MSAKTESLEDLLEYLRAERGFDFTGYKRSTLTRRVQKRMQEVGVEAYTAYQEYLEVHPDEFEALFNTILINVTRFFRDEEAWAYVRAEIVPRLLRRLEPDAPMRVWSAGCASGEEAYTLAIVLAEAMGAEAFRRRVKIYATDADAEALAQARHGVYAAKAVEAVPEELREKYFERAGERRCAFRMDLRRNVIFGQLDLVQSAPISRVDLLACRNTLMYFNAEVQARILARFHFALRDEGYLFVGNAEMLLTHGNLFRPVDLPARVFAKTPGASRDRLLTLARAVRDDAGRLPRHARIREAALDASTVAQVVLDGGEHVVYANAAARQAFGVREEDFGRPFRDLELSYRPAELRSVIDAVKEARAAKELPPVERFLPDGVRRWLEVQVVPLGAGAGVDGISILFRDVTAVVQLQDDLRASKHAIETAYEEVQSTNEELETTNEELQSTVEELETTNEELQSTNEELETMNEELRMRTEEANRVSGLMEAILGSITAGIVVLDPGLRVTVWSGRARELWGLLDEEVAGAYFFDLDIGLPTDGLRAQVEACRRGTAAAAEVVVDAVNRRGRPIRCRVVCSMLARADGGPPGVILQMEDWTRTEAEIGPATAGGEDARSRFKGEP